MAEEKAMSEVATEAPTPAAVAERKITDTAPDVRALLKRATDGDKSCLKVEGAQRLFTSIAIVHGRSVCTSKYRPSGENMNGP
jgi:hypothetical protein